MVISTASLPDIVFMLLFFFMVTTVMRKGSMKVRVDAPVATQAQKLEKKSLTSYIYIGPPAASLQSLHGKETRIQLNDAFASVEDIAEFIELERRKHSERDRVRMVIQLKIDKAAKMGIVNDVKEELKKANAYNISYSAKKTEEK